MINTCKEQDNQSESMKSINKYAAIFNPGVNHKKGGYYEQLCASENLNENWNENLNENRGVINLFH